MIRASLTVGFALAACSQPSREPATTAPPPSPTRDAAPAVAVTQPEEPAPMSKLPTVRDAASVAQHSGQVVEAVGRYAILSTGRHKVMRTLPDGSTVATTTVVRLGLDGDVWVNLWIRPDAEMKQLKDQTVVVTGKLVAAPAATGPGARPDPAPSLVEISEIRAAAAP